MPGGVCAQERRLDRLRTNQKTSEAASESKGHYASPTVLEDRSLTTRHRKATIESLEHPARQGLSQSRMPRQWIKESQNSGSAMDRPEGGPDNERGFSLTILLLFSSIIEE